MIGISVNRKGDAVQPLPIESLRIDSMGFAIARSPKEPESPLPTTGFKVVRGREKEKDLGFSIVKANKDLPPPVTYIVFEQSPLRELNNICTILEEELAKTKNSFFGRTDLVDLKNRFFMRILEGGIDE